MTHPSYPTNIKLIDWLAEVRPGFEVKPNPMYPVFWIARGNGEAVMAVQMPSINELGIKEYPDDILCPAITFYHLHTILWELFKCENPEYTHMIKTGIGNPDKWIIRTLADALWTKYTGGNPSMWQASPELVLEDIIKEYEKLQ